jgi:putative ABC transport system permease protein
MFLALNEIKRNKLRYGLITIVIIMIAYLIFMLTALANGLSNASKQAVNSWQAHSIVLNADANGSLDQSVISIPQLPARQSTHANVIQMGANVQTTRQKNPVSAQVLGIQNDQFIYHDLKIIQGRRFTHPQEIVVDQSLFNSGYHLGQWVRFKRGGNSFHIVGAVKNTTLNVAPVIYGQLKAIQQVKWGQTTNHNISAVIYRGRHVKEIPGTKVWTINDFIENIPGYSAQNSTFSFMIIFLLLITMVIIAIFLYILTIQKIPYFAVMKIQGIPNRLLAGNVISTALLLTSTGIFISGILTAITAIAMPAAVPMTFDIKLMSLVIILLFLMALVGSLIPMRIVNKIDPAIAMGGK